MRTMRRKRIPFGTARQKLTVDNKEEGYVYRWFNDKPGRLSAALQAGYEFVADVSVGDTGEENTDIGSRVSQVVSEEGQRAYLMRTKQEWYDEDQAAKQVEISKTEDAIRRRKYQLGNEPDKMYAP